MRIKDFYLSFLNENEHDFLYLDGNSVKSIDDVTISKKENFIKIEFKTTYGKILNIVSNYDDFIKWYNKHKNENEKSEDIFKDYVKKFSECSKQTESFFGNINEIIDDNGDIMPSTDLPSNATNSMVGSKLKWDLEKVYKSTIPRSIRYYSGDLGIGMVTW